MLLSPDHTGTAVPLLVTWLLIDRARPRWYVPPLVGLLFAWTMVADSIVLITGIIPLVLVCALRARPGLTGRGPRRPPGGTNSPWPGRPWRPAWSARSRRG